MLTEGETVSVVTSSNLTLRGGESSSVKASASMAG